MHQYLKRSGLYAYSANKGDLSLKIKGVWPLWLHNNMAPHFSELTLLLFFK